MIRQSGWSTLLTPVIHHHFDLGQSMVPSFRGQLFTVLNSMLADEKGTGIGGMSVDAWDQYKVSGEKGRLDFDEQYTFTYTHVEYPVQLSVEKQLLINDQYGVMAGRFRKAGISAEQHMEIDAASLLNNAFDTNFTWGDSKALCVTDHPTGPNDSSNTYSNKGTTAISKTAVSDTRVDMMQFKDDKGNLLGIVADEIWVPPELEDTALEIAGSQFDPESAENAINPQNGRFRVIPWLRLTDTNNWFMASSTWRRESVKWYFREPLQVMQVSESTTHVTFELKLHYSYGVDDWRWIFGHEVA